MSLGELYWYLVAEKHLLDNCHSNKECETIGKETQQFKKTYPETTGYWDVVLS